MRGVLTIAVLRFMDSFIYAEPFVLTGGGLGLTTFLSIYLVKSPLASSTSGPAPLLDHLLPDRAALVLGVLRASCGSARGTSDARPPGQRRPDRLPAAADAADLLDAQHVLRTNADILGTFSLVPTTPTLANYADRIFTDPAWYGAYLNSIIYVTMNMVISVPGALPPTRSRATSSSATSTCSSGC